jgi:site-specific recombinase XerD
MPNEMIVITARLPSADVSRAACYAANHKAESTHRAYQGDFALFQAWCAARGVPALPASPVSVAGFLAAEADAGKAASTIGRRCAAIRHFHRLAGHEPPTNAESVKVTLQGIRRTIGAGGKPKAPAIAEVTLGMAKAAPEGLKGLRHRALLLLGFGGAFRRSELVALDVSDVEFTDDGLRVTSAARRTALSTGRSSGRSGRAAASWTGA